MNKLVLLIVGAVVVVVVGGIVYFSSRGGQPGQETTNGDEAGAPQSLRDLLSARGAQMCEFETEVEGSYSEGVIYAANGKLRGDFTSEQNGQMITSHMIIDGQEVFSWVDGMPAGFRMSVGEATGEEGDDGQALDVDEQVDYRCQSWREDASQFQLPAGVEFTAVGDFSAAPPASGGTGSSDNAQALQCAACESLTGEDQAACKAALSCP